MHKSAKKLSHDFRVKIALNGIVLNRVTHSLARLLLYAIYRYIICIGIERSVLLFSTGRI